MAIIACRHSGARFFWIGLGILACVPGPLGSARAADATQGGQSVTQSYALSCPPDFLTEIEQKMYAKEGTIHSGPWHVKCFQNGTPIYDRDRLYVYCGRGATQAGLEGADGHAIRFQFPNEVACIWER